MNSRHRITAMLGVMVLALSATTVVGATAPGDLTLNIDLEGKNFSKAVNILLLLTLLSVAPSFVMMMTSFTRIVIVLAFLKQALGIQQGLSAKTTGALALFLTLFIMQPVWQEIYDNAIVPYTEQRIDQDAAMQSATRPIKVFMLTHTRDESLLLFMDLAGIDAVESPEQLAMRIVVPAFMLSELKTAFQIGFLLYLPFLLVDIVVATVLMSMGMIMLPPMMISLPFKLLLFVLVDGWNLLFRTLVAGFY